MRFSCDSCQAKYSIPDERVEGKIVRLKCQKCGAEIVVKGAPRATQPEQKTTAEAPKPTRQQPPEPPPKTAKIAPITRIEDRPAVRLDDNAFGGDEDEEPRESTRIASLTELERMRAEAANDQQKPKQEKKKTPPPPPSTPALKAEWLVLVSGTQQGPLTEDDVRLKLASGELHSRSYMWKEGMGEWQRLQNISEFSDIVLTKNPEPQKKPEGTDFDSVFGKPGDPPRREPPPLDKPLELDPEPSGPLEFADELPDEHHDPSRPATGEVPLSASFGQDPVEPARESTRQFMAAAGMNEQKKKQRLIIGAALAVVLLLVGVIVLDLLGVITLLGAKEDETKPNAPQGASQPASMASVDALSDQEKTRLREGLLGKKNEAPKTENEKSAASAQQAGNEKKSAPEKAEGAENKLLADVYGDSAKTAVRVEAPTFKTAEQDLPAGINAEAITKVVESNQRAVKLCLERELKHGGALSGKLEVEFSIAPTGLVTNVGIKTAKFKGTEFGECVVGAVKAWKFPRFSGDPVPVEYPFILSSGM